MSIYPDKSLTPTSTGYLEQISEPGLVRRRELVAGPWTQTRTDCYCCSCDDDVDGFTTTDPCCRNHGWWGVRPCERHAMPGYADDEGVLPISVQAKRRATGRTEGNDNL